MSDLIEARRKAAFAACPETGCDWGSFLRGYNAALDSVVVELPPKISSCNTLENGFVHPNAEHYDEAIDDCAEAIHAAGIPTKVKV